ncbi:MAG: adenylate/guanylate cyclase domain-containing protein [Phenylobacterium sp.]|jgi:class 3 adenylate cyclase|uniref:adenylate/guanylate cyclase domain-containing protein n=1 Tax=Phenylobacterium sp. TaxID=1871053 RepID=UPI002A2B5F3B|nr:adenylate/guanylate cyclase domain-containing protein [Phenylobacterium sp.]MDD3836492.1 adenylate/guanylate cyclase domain-containing protein [Phenylobacterium sp.]MDX9998269.1 adenylate/guanylate cyclase domain-containing protein [Phenylobacterium sp.]
MTASIDVTRAALQALDCAVACAGPDGAILFENSRFFEWFAPDPAAECDVWTRLAPPHPERARERVAQGRAYTFEVERQKSVRTLCLSVSVRPLGEDAGAGLLVQAFDVSKTKEAEYMLDSYSKMAERNAKDLQREKERVEKLLLNIMPRTVYEELRDYGTTTPQRFESGSVLMLDFVGFTDMAISRDPGALISELNDIFSAFDRIVELFGCERIKTIGDAYVAVSGLPEYTPDHAANIAKVALRMRRYIDRRNSAHTTQWLCRIGIATGPVIGSMVGIQKYVYDIFGPAPNLAARLEALSDPMQITVNRETADALGSDFVLSPQGPVTVKGFGEVELFSLDAERAVR